MINYVLEVTTAKKKTYIPCMSKLGAQELRTRVLKYKEVLGTRILFSLPDGYLYPIHEDKT